jgi:hypothetical protein
VTYGDGLVDNNNALTTMASALKMAVSRFLLLGDKPEVTSPFDSSIAISYQFSKHITWLTYTV